MSLELCTMYPILAIVYYPGNYIGKLVLPSAHNGVDQSLEQCRGVGHIIERLTTSVLWLPLVTSKLLRAASHPVNSSGGNG